MNRIWAAGALALVAALSLGGPASAAPSGLPKINLCSHAAPVPNGPDAGLPGLFITRPDHPVAAEGVADPARLLETSGFSGMDPFTYDLGCALNPATYGQMMRAIPDESLDDQFVAVGQTTTAATDAVDRLAWSPTWVISLLGALAKAADGVISRQVILPFLGLGLIAATLSLMKFARRGRTDAVMSHVMWIGIVLVVGAFVTLAPTMVATSTQSGMGTVTAALHADGRTTIDPASAATDTVLRTVHYNGWLNRTFGTSSSGTARQYGPRLLADTRITWAQQQATDPSLATSDADRADRLLKRKALLQQKSDDFKKVADLVRRNDPSAYEWMTGKHGSSQAGAFEMGSAIIAAYFRLAVDVLMVLCVILLTLLGIVWLLASPWLVLPQGERMGRNLLDNTSRAVGYVVIAGLGSWLFSVYTDVVMQPGWPTWVSVFLLAVGSFVFWTALRPDRRALSLLTMGRVRGNGRFTRKVIGAATGYALAGFVGGRTFMAAAGDELRPGPNRAEREEAVRVRTDELLSYPVAPTVAAPPVVPPVVPPLYVRDGADTPPDPSPPEPGAAGAVFVRGSDVVKGEIVREEPNP